MITRIAIGMTLICGLTSSALCETIDSVRPANNIAEDDQSDAISKRVADAAAVSNTVPLAANITAAYVPDARAVQSSSSNRSTSTRCTDGLHDPLLIKAMIVAEAERQNADARLALAIADQESGFGVNVNSSAGARGIMQLMPATAAHYGVNNICDATQNIRGGIAFLKDLNTTFGGNIMLMIAAYNSGEDRVLKTGGIPSISETVNYTARVTNAYYGFDNTLKGGKRAKSNAVAKSTAQPTTGVTELPVQIVSDGSPIPINQPKTATTRFGGGLADRQQWIGGSVLYVQ